jgi:dipeptidyl aminopeptidase/acylaminoacyl peptidase
MIDLKTGKVSDSGWNSSEVSEYVWLPGTGSGILYINGTGETPGGVSLWIGDVKNPKGSTKVAELDAPYSGLKVANTSSGDLHFLVNSLAYPNGTAYNAETAEPAKSSARFYSDIYVRHWDTWLTKQRYNVFSGVLSSNGSYALSGAGMRNLNHAVNFTTTASETPVQPFGDSSDYDISPDGKMYAFLSKAPHLNKANYTASYVYLGAFGSSEVAVAFNGPDSPAAKAGHQGASGQPSFSPDSCKLAYVQQDQDYYESDRWQLYVTDVATNGSSVTTSNWKNLSPNFDRWVQGPLTWTEDNASLYVTAEDYARVRIFNFPVSGPSSPKALTSNTTVTSFSLLPGNSLLVTASAIWTPTEYYILSNGQKQPLFNAADVDVNLAGCNSNTFSEIFYNGSDPNLKQQLHAIVVKPTNYVANQTYPLAFIIHGGPQGANMNSWSTRWNPQVWADQGYIVVAPNPTGSTGFGQYLTDAIQGQWGGYPYEDLINAWTYVDTEMKSTINTTNGIAAGASYGG